MRNHHQRGKIRQKTGKLLEKERFRDKLNESRYGSLDPEMDSTPPGYDRKLCFHSAAGPKGSAAMGSTMGPAASPHGQVFLFRHSFGSD